MCLPTRRLDARKTCICAGSLLRLLGGGAFWPVAEPDTVDGEARFGEPKTRRSRRSVDIGAGLVAALRAHRARQLEERVALGLGRDDDGLVFCQPDGSPLRPRRVSVEFRRAVDATDLPRLSFHGLRHTHAAHLVASGAHVRAIVERLGHSSASFSLDKYAHLLPTLGAEAATRIETLVDGSGQ
jgi:integrase